MSLNDLGYYYEIEVYQKEHNLETFEIGRIISEHKDRYIVKTAENEFDAELIGKLRYAAQDRHDLPAVGDWVAISAYDENKALIHALFPRKTILERKAIGKLGQTQIIATNIDVGLIVQSVNRDFNINRLERYLTICNAAKIEPILIISKVDLVDKEALKILLNQVQERIKNVPLFAVSNQSQQGIDQLKSTLIKGLTYCLLGSSGVGKSSLINTLTGKKSMDTGEISERIDRGKHITSHRELVVLENGILIDNPGMREVGITNISEGLEMTFNQILRLTQSCRFSDCTHINEMGCAVLEALESEELDAEAYANFIKMEKERNHYELDAQERKRKDKEFGKMVKEMKKHKRNNKY